MAFQALVRVMQKSLRDLDKFENELKTTERVNSACGVDRQIREEMFYTWIKRISSGKDEPGPAAPGVRDYNPDFDDLSEPEDYDGMSRESSRLREEGNRVYISANGTSRNILSACEIYTQALYAAPKRSEALSLAYANRAAMLQQFGYYVQAYDDCVIALELPYPKNLRQKVLMRQAKCAAYLGDGGALMQLHMAELETQELSDPFAKQFGEMREQLKKLQQSKKEKEIKQEKEAAAAAGVGDGTKNGAAQTENKTKIVRSDGPAGRHLVAAQTIKPHEAAFSDCAVAFTSVNKDVLHCQHCASTQIIPIPCKRCLSRIVYCSLKCRDEHAPIHVYECAGYKRNIINDADVGHLALRAVVEGMPQVLPLLRDKPNAEAMWTALVGDGQSNKDCIAESDTLPYAQLLRMTHHLGKNEHQLRLDALMADLLVIYLKKFTDYFKQLEDTLPSERDWDLITAALILRHIGQCRANEHQMQSLVPISRKHKKYSLLLQDVWASPWRLQNGSLHHFHEFETIAKGTFIHGSLRNHSCERLFHQRWSGRHMTVYPLAAVSEGSEITNCYTEDNRRMKREYRGYELEGKHEFKCECVKCVKDDPDEELHEFHRYRCDNPECRQMFVPRLPFRNMLNWWSVENKEAPAEDKVIKCTVCGVNQNFEWMILIHKLFARLPDPASRRMLYQVTESLHQWLLDTHELRVDLSLRVVVNCFDLHCAGGTRLTDFDFDKLSEILKYSLSGFAALYGEFSLQYVGKMTILWDFIGLGKCKCTRGEMQQMLQVVNETVSDEFKALFMNYYEDYIMARLDK